MRCMIVGPAMLKLLLLGGRLGSAQLSQDSACTSQKDFVARIHGCPSAGVRVAWVSA